ncbi:MAG: tetratricopeptide repeat protein, partial [Planctomycetia bacterium]|nr:tetratricopeptide repeat protein [Planctomycetia bacterium]
MTCRKCFAHLSLFLPFAICLTLLAAAPPSADSPDELIRRANDAFRAGDTAAADNLYAAAEELTADPGLVAFNRGAVLFERGNFREAELQYTRVLDDAACPPERAAKAWYNRGTCLLRRGPSMPTGAMGVYRSAIACFEHTLDSPAADEPLKADARYNLELAKLLWNEARKKSADQKSPNDPPPEEEQPQPKPNLPEKQDNGTDPNFGSDPGAGMKTVGKQPQQIPNAGTKPTQAEKPIPANNANVEVLQDKDEVQQLSQEDTRLYLQELAKRLKREQRAMLRTLYGPERPGIRDW